MYVKLNLYNIVILPKFLVIVESPNKTKKIESILGSDYNVQASYGHIMDLDPKNLSIDITNNFKPTYIITPEKTKVVANLKFHADKCDEVIIASDSDREGEAIGYSVMTVLQLTNPKRIVFNAITKTAIMNAIAKPITLNMDMIYAQQTRRLLDRLMGYMISPVLQKYLQGGLSAGRVQSVVVRIIADMETKVNESIENILTKPFFKSTSIFRHGDYMLDTVLMSSNEVFKLPNKDNAIDILNKINKNTICMVSNVSVKETKKSSPPAHITSSLMQDASTKLGMNSKYTMDIAQKLYEGGYITYMRTDSVMLSPEAVSEIRGYIVKNYGDAYYMSKKYKTDALAQEAHEAIRPTHVEVEVLDETDDMNKLYNIIWKRAVASLMTDAKINVQTVDITMDVIPENTIYRATFEEIKFDGYLVLYNDHETENKKGHITITTSVKVQHIETHMNETFINPSLRYNEAGLIKYLKNEGIGRPSTYASIITKVVEREYVEIKNIDGIDKNILLMSVSCKKYGSINEKIKVIKIGSEKIKIVPTPLGIKVNDFMMKHFASIMGIEFTAGMETLLDNVSQGKMKWYNVLNEYYKIFNPIVELLNSTAPSKLLLKNEDINLGQDDAGNMIYLSNGKYGWCVKMLVDSEWKYASIGDMKHTNVKLDDAIQLLRYPKQLGKIGSMIVSINRGKFGLYFKVGSKNVNIKNADEELNLEYAKKLYLEENEKEQNTFIINGKKIFIKTGEHGPYIMIPHGSKKPQFISIPTTLDHTKMTATKIKELIDAKKAQFKKS